jgi:hypothetical protein
VLELFGVTCTDLNHFAVRAVALEAKLDHVLSGRHVEPLVSTVEFVDRAGVVSVEPDFGLFGLHQGPNRTRI